MNTAPTPATFDLIAHLTENLGWVRREPGDVIEPETPIAFAYPEGHVASYSDGTGFQRRVASNEVVYTPPPPEPAPWTLIPEGRKNARDLYVNGVPGRYFRCVEWAEIVDPLGAYWAAIRLEDIRTVTPIRQLADDDVAVKRDVVKSIIKDARAYLSNRDFAGLEAALAEAGDPQ